MTRSPYSAALQAARAAQRAERAHARELARQSTIKKREVIMYGTANVAALNRDLCERIEALENILQNGLARHVGLNWNRLYRRVDEIPRKQVPEPQYEAPPNLVAAMPWKPGFLERCVPGWKRRFNRKLAYAQEALAAAKEKHAATISAAKKKHASEVRVQQNEFSQLEAQVNEHNSKISELRDGYRAGDPHAVSAFFDLVFDQAEPLEGFPSHRRIIYLRESKQLALDFDLPLLENAVPLLESYSFKKNQVVEKKKTPKVQQALYSSVVAQSVLMRLHEIFIADREELVDVAAVSAFVDAVDRSNGKSVRPCLVSVRVTRDDFLNLELGRVDPLVCLRRLNASVSRSPADLVAVKPIVDFDMIDPRFIEETDVLSTLDSRPNLMELTPGEFENLITNVFQQMGLETKLTQASRDGGVDCVAFDPRPVLGGKFVIQAKRYKNTVGVSAVRDLFGTMHNEGASKGILVTTSGYGKAAFEFANGKPIELLSGSELLYLLKEHAGIEAKIVIPDDWCEPQMDF